MEGGESVMDDTRYDPERILQIWQNALFQEGMNSTASWRIFTDTPWGPLPSEVTPTSKKFVPSHIPDTLRELVEKG